jgi:3-keto-disaccharide hydrolase
MKRMKTILLFFATILVSFSIISCTGETLTEPVQSTDISEFIGQWTIDIQGGGVGWLEVRQEDKYLDADLLWWGGSVLPVSNVYLSNNRYLIVTRNNNIVRTKDDKDLPLRSQVITNWLELTRDGDKIVGFLISPRRDGSGVDSVSMVGTKLPAPPPAPDLASIKFGEPVTLFNGKDLTGWRLINEESANGYSAIDGVLDVNPAQVEGEEHIHYGNLRTDAVFEDFNIKLEVNIPAGSNSGVYLRGMYEIQVFDSYKKELDSHNMGGVYSRITPTVNAEKPAGTWQTLDITLCDRHSTVILNGIKIIDNQPVYGPTGGAIISDVFAPGPIYLQGDHGKVQYRNIVLTPIVK